MRITDIIFFGIIAIAITLIFMSFVFPLDDYVCSWWILPLPVLITKVFFPKSKFTKWLEKERWN